LKEVLGVLKGIDISQIIFMGAEPTIDPKLPELTFALHQELHTYNVLLTNGLRPAQLEHIDEIVLSLKAYTESLHQDYTGRPNKTVLGNFVKLYAMGKKLRAESIFIPDYIGSPEIERIAKFIARIDRNIPYRIDAYLPVGDNPWRRPAPVEVEGAARVARRHLSNVSCLRGDEKLEYEIMRIV
jgi:pyruvate-formate lyase-activating enzyme